MNNPTHERAPVETLALQHPAQHETELSKLIYCYKFAFFFFFSAERRRTQLKTSDHRSPSDDKSRTCPEETVSEFCNHTASPFSASNQ